MSYDLFDNPAVKAARASMDAKQLADYQQWGENLFSVQHESISAFDPRKNKLNYILTGIRSGLQPEDLDEDEIEFLREDWGDEWKEHLLSTAFPEDVAPEDDASTS